MSAGRHHRFDVLIVGAGVVGAAMANLLLSRKVCEPGRVALVTERLPAPPTADWDLRVFALSRASQRLLRACAVWQRLPDEKMLAYERMCVWDSQVQPSDRGALRFDCAEIGEPDLGCIVEGRSLQWHSLEAARAAGAMILEGRVEALRGKPDMVVRLADGREVQTQLLIAADGTQSRTRQMLSIETAGHSYVQDALIAHVRTRDAHRNTCWQRFLPTGPLAFLPLPDGRSSIVWSTTSSEARRLAAMQSAQFGEALTAASGAVLGQCELTTPVASYPLKLQYAVRYIRPRAALLGDAAHVVHPLAGQGLNLGLLDCAALTQVLEQARAAGGSRDFGDQGPLRRYERWRRSENLLAAAALDALERVFTSTGALGTGLRAAGLGVASRLPMARRYLAQRALGMSGDLPELVRRD